MTRYTSTVESVAALSPAVPSGAAAGGLFANILGNQLTGGRTLLRRLTLGVRAGSGAPNSQQLTVAFARTTARGTATTSNPWSITEGFVGVTAPGNPGIDVAWSAVPTATSWTAPYFWEVSFNTQATVDLPWELLEELGIQPAAANANGIALFNVGNALPTAHLYTLACEIEI